MQDQVDALKRAVAEMARRKVLITGLGRGGTTSIAAMLHHAGFNLSGAPEPDAYFEDENLRALLLDRQYAQVQDELERRAERHGLVAWKDPKLYSEYGLELTRRLADDWTLVAVFRDPVATVSRRMTADQVDFSGSMEHVVRFMRKLQKFAADVEKQRPVLYVSYEKVITEPISSIRGIFDSLGADIGEDGAAYLWTHMRRSQKLYVEAANAVASAPSPGSSVR
jgi:hypothetical protein